jgi:hypothetical protein
MLMPQGGGGQQQPAGAQPSAATYQVPKASQDAIRKGEQDSADRTDAAEDERLDRSEKEALQALEVSLGKRAWNQNAGNPAPASETLLALKKTTYKLKVEPVTDGDGNAVGGGNYLQLTDSGTQRLQELARKSAEGRTSAAERKEMQNYTKYSFKLMDIRMQFMKVSVAAFTSNSDVQTTGLTTMLTVAGMVRTHKMMNMEWTDDDYARVKRRLERLHRAEAIAASTMGMVAAYQAVVNNGGDPKAIDAIADNTLKAFPLKPVVTDDEAKQYVAGLKDNVAAQKAKYEKMMRAAYGDAKYEKNHKASIDAMFKQAEDAQDQKSVGQMQQDTMSKYNADVAKCARGEDPGPGSLVGPAKCKAARAQAQQGAGGGGAGAGGGPAVPGQVQQGMGVANAAANGDVSGALDGAAKMFPSDGTIGASLSGISALTKGDPKGALSAAMSLVPGGGLVKDGLSFAANLLFGGSKKG